MVNTRAKLRKVIPLDVSLPDVIEYPIPLPRTPTEKPTLDCSDMALGGGGNTTLPRLPDETPRTFARCHPFDALELAVRRHLSDLGVPSARAVVGVFIQQVQEQGLLKVHPKRCGVATCRGTPCKRMKVAGKEACVQHLVFTPQQRVRTLQQCQGITKAGRRCGKACRRGQGTCWRHATQGVQEKSWEDGPLEEG
jgi:hypothetical protein